jgi:hypothetical protein
MITTAVLPKFKRFLRDKLCTAFLLKTARLDILTTTLTFTKRHLLEMIIFSKTAS